MGDSCNLHTNLFFLNFFLGTDCLKYLLGCLLCTCSIQVLIVSISFAVNFYMSIKIVNGIVRLGIR